MKILVVGASARAAAQSIRRAGLPVAALDLFVDRDLQECAECEAISRFPQSIARQAERWPDYSILLAGGMENYPEVVRQLERHRSIIGPNASQILVLRDLARWRSSIDEQANEVLRFPKSQFVQPNEPMGKVGIDGTNKEKWLWKAYRSAGGMRTFPASHPIESSGEGYWQQYIPGPVLGMVFYCDAGKTFLLGTTRNWSLSDLDEPTSKFRENHPFLYVRSSGPIHVEEEISRKLENWLGTLTASIDYRGLLQVDFIASDDGSLYFLECNPRWSSGMEVIEMVYGINLVQCQLSNEYATSAYSARTEAVSVPIQAVKHIVYSNQTLVVSKELSNAMAATMTWGEAKERGLTSAVGWSDIPCPGTKIEQGAPLATVWSYRPSSATGAFIALSNERSEWEEQWPEIDGILAQAWRYSTCRNTVHGGD